MIFANAFNFIAGEALIPFRRLNTSVQLPSATRRRAGEILGLFFTALHPPQAQYPFWVARQNDVGVAAPDDLAPVQ